MGTVRRFANRLLFKVRGTLAIAVLAAIGVAAFAGLANGAAVTQAAEPGQKPASGTVAVTDRSILLSYHDGRDLVQERYIHRKLTGTIAGTEVAVVH